MNPRSFFFGLFFFHSPFCCPQIVQPSDRTFLPCGHIAVHHSMGRTVMVILPVDLLCGVTLR